MRTSRNATTTAVARVAPLIEETVALERRIQALQLEAAGQRAAIRAALQKAGLARLATPFGCEALLIQVVALQWNARALRKVLTPREFETLLPRRPDAGALRGLLENAVDRKSALRSCARARHAVRLELRGTPVRAQATA